jgi:hypothetical protein
MFNKKKKLFSFLFIEQIVKVGEFTLLTSYQKSLIRLVACVKSYELRERSTVIEVKVSKTGRAWKFRFAVICSWL